MHPSLTEHARARMQQRGISRHALELLLDFGREAFRHFERYFNAYAVVAEDDAVVTVGHRMGRMGR